MRDVSAVLKKTLADEVRLPALLPFGALIGTAHTSQAWIDVVLHSAWEIATKHRCSKTASRGRSLKTIMLDTFCDAAGSLTRDFKHLAVDMFILEEDGQKKLKVEAHFGKRKALASIRTCCSHVVVCCPSLPVEQHLVGMFVCTIPEGLSDSSMPRECQGYWSRSCLVIRHIPSFCAAKCILYLVSHDRESK